MGVAVGFGVLAGAVASQWSHVVGSSPILAALVCAACLLRMRELVIVGVVAMLTHDAISGVSGFTLVRLAAILSVIGILGIVRVRLSVKSLVIGLGVSAPVYHAVLTMGDWVTQTCSKAPLTFQGLQQTVASSLPYAGRSMLTDTVFAGAFLTLYLLAGLVMASRWPALFRAPAPSTIR
jgi:hypothetical protein